MPTRMMTSQSGRLSALTPGAFRASVSVLPILAVGLLFSLASSSARAITAEPGSSPAEATAEAGAAEAGTPQADAPDSLNTAAAGEAPATPAAAPPAAVPQSSHLGLKPSRRATGTGPAYIVRLDGMVDLGMAPMLARALREAKEAGAAGLVIDVNTLGGRVDAALLIRDALLESDLPTTCWVNRRAISAGALICLAADSIDMAPGSTMGAATPVMEGPDGEMTAADSKMISYLLKEFGATAEARERRRDIAEAMVDRDLVVEGFSKEGELLTLTTDEALRADMATASSDTLDAALETTGLGGRTRVHVVMSWAERGARALTNPILAGFLLSIGFLGIILELKTPGFGIPGKLGIMALLLFFAGHHLALLAGWEHLALMFLGIGLLALEIFVIPGFGVAGLTGILCLLAGVLLAMTGSDVREAVILGRMHDALATLSGAVLVTGISLPLIAHWLPRSSIGQRTIILGDSLDTTNDPAAFGSDLTQHLGREGVAHTVLRPSGTVMLEGERVDAVSEGEIIESGTAVRVVGVRGPSIVVRALPAADPKRT